MKAYHLTESEMPQSVAIIFGRFNPPHKGHKHAWETAAQNGQEWYVGTNRSTIGPDDPLPFDVKIEAMKTIMPEVADHLVAEQSWWTLATYVFKKFGGIPGRTLPFELIVITDEPYVVPGLLKSNGVPGPHGEYSFQNIRIPFDSIEQAKKHLRISSATALRNAVANGDREGFAEAAGVPADTEVAGHPFFDLVAHYLMPHRAAHAAKEKAKAEKAAAKAEKEKLKAEKQAMKAKGPAQELAEIAGAFPSPSTRKYWADQAAASNRAMAAQEAERQRQANAAAAAKLAVNTSDVERLSNTSYHGASAPQPSNASWDGDSSFLDLDGTQYAMASRMPISGDVPPDMKLIVTKEGRQVYIWTRNGLTKNKGHYFYPAANPKTVREGRISEALIALEEGITSGAGYKAKGGTMKIDKEFKASMQNATTIPGLNQAHGSAYTGYRFGLALAGAPTYPTKMEADTWIAGDPLLSTYTEEEFEMVAAAAKQVGAGTIENWSGKRSQEMADTQKTSPVAKPKKNKYGV